MKTFTSEIEFTVSASSSFSILNKTSFIPALISFLGTFDLSGIPPASRGVPKIDVTFDIDANGILNVSALESSTGKSKRITIKNDKGRLSQKDIERMLAEAEQYKEEDDRQRERIASRNSLETYLFSVKQAAEDAGNKISADDKRRIQKECDNCMKWLDSNQLADKDEFEYKLKEIQRICSPIMTKLHRGGGKGGYQEEATAGDQDGPTIEEVD